jgi:murein DD-endopeptidase
MSKDGRPYRLTPLVSIPGTMLCRRVLVVLAAFLASACASMTSARPSAFPTAPAAPAALGPAPPPAGQVSSALIQTALGFQGIPYRLGGDSPSSGFDCSGFVQYVFSLNYITLPRTVLEQSAVGRRINPRDARAGDLLFFATGSRGVSHVGIATAGSQFVHAPTDKGVVRIDSVESPYWRDRFLEARRIVPGS